MRDDWTTGSDLQAMKQALDRYIEFETGDRTNQIEIMLRSKPELANDVIAMLAAMQSAMHEESASGAKKLTHPEESIGQRLGPFQLTRILGSGGMGNVFLAKRIDGGFEQEVAIKIARQTEFEQALRHQFLSERQLLAKLRHPNIAQLIDGGVSERGQPWLAMELIDGTTLVEHVNSQALSVRARLQLWLSVADAIDCAHRHLIVHGDLKPNNLLITKDGVPKLIDFGVARMLAEGRAETGATGYTPAYAAPEQVSGRTVSTLTDVYGLGALLFELLTGKAPFAHVESKDLKEAILSEPPPNLGQCAESAMTRIALPNEQAVQLRSERASFVSQLDLELNAIIHKALSKAQEQRYSSARAFADDIERYLRGELVVAMPKTAGYVAKKFVARHKASLAGVAATILMLAAGMVSFAWQAKRTAERAAELEQVAAFHAEMIGQLDQAEAGKLLSDDVLNAYSVAIHRQGMQDRDRASSKKAFADQWQQVNATEVARNLIDNAIIKPAVAAIEERFKDQPLIAASLRQALADRYMAMAMPQSARPLQERALEIRRKLLGRFHPDTLLSIHRMGVLLQTTGDLAEAEAFDTEVLAIRRELLGEEHPDTLSALEEVAFRLQLQGRTAEAESDFRHILSTRQGVLGSDHIDTLAAMNNLASFLSAEARNDEAIVIYADLVERCNRVLGEGAGETLIVTVNFAGLLVDQGRADEAERYYLKSWQAATRVYGELDYLPLIAGIGLGNAWNLQGRHDDSAGLLESALPTIRKQFTGGNKYRLGRALTVLGQAHFGQGRVAQAETELLEAQSIFDASPGLKFTGRKECLHALIMLYESLAEGTGRAEHREQASHWRQVLESTQSDATARG